MPWKNGRWIPEPPQPSTPEITFTPDGQQRAPGFLNPSNPWDTGYSGNVNAEVALRNGMTPGKMDGWNYDTGTPGPNYNPNQYGGGGGGGGGGGTGGGAGALGSSPYYQQVLAAVNAGGAADAASRRSAIQQALIGWGEVPGDFKDRYGDIDELTRSLASKNTLTGISTKARLLQARADAIRQFSRSLSARGLRRWGAKGYGLRRRQLQFDQGYADELSKLLGYTGNLYSQFGQNEYQRQLALANALAYASSQMGGYGGGGGGGSGARDPNTPYSNPFLPDYSTYGTQTPVPSGAAALYGGSGSYSSSGAGRQAY